MPPKQKVPAPIDRPLSRAYLREFSGWSTAYPPGLSEPTSLRVMENMMVNRDGSLRVRPGLKYLSYEVAPSDFTDAESGQIVMPFGSGGWKYLRVPLSDTSDKSAPDFDDSAWSIGAMPFGNGSGLGWTPAVTAWTEQERIWARKEITVPAGTATLVIEGRIDNYLDVYIDGELKFTTGITDYPSQAVSGTFVISAGTHTIAVRASDDTTLHSGDGTYCDVQLTLGVLTLTSGIAYDRPFVGTHEPFYLNDGTKAYLLAVREEDETVGFRVLVVDINDSTMYPLTHSEIDFAIPHGEAVLNFSSGTTFVKYLQIDNKIFALSDNGEPMRVFYVGAEKKAKTLLEITVPEWDASDKLNVMHPDAAWINGREPDSKRRNRLTNPSFEVNHKGWETSEYTDLDRPQSPAVTPVSGSRVARLTSKPERTNLATQPLHDVATTGITGWVPGTGDPTLSADTSWAKLTIPAAKGDYYARSRLLDGIRDTRKYKVSFDVDRSGDIYARCKIRFYGVNGAQVGKTVTEDLSVLASGRWTSPAIPAPANAVSIRVSIGAENMSNTAAWVKFKRVLVAQADEPTDFFHGGSGTDFFWTGTANNSASVYHPPQSLELTSEMVNIPGNKEVAGSLYVQAGTTARDVTFRLQDFNKLGAKIGDSVSAATPDTAGAWTRMTASSLVLPQSVKARIRLQIPNVPRGEYHYVDAGLLEINTMDALPYFDGSTADVPLETHEWHGDEHGSYSVKKIYLAAAAIPTPEDRTADTLQATGGKAANPYNFGFFYTFNNEVGESAASMITLRRASRAWTEWLWETPNALGEPSGTGTDDPNKAADQFVAVIPEEVFNEALAQGATSWSLYMFTWSDQDPSPVVALKVAVTELPDGALYAERGWARVTPQRPDITDDAPLPSEANRTNFTDPSHGGQGLVAADRMILVNDPTAPGVIRWTSNQMGEYTNFTAAKGGGYKTLTSGNLYVPAAVKLWQNPQSVDTLTILCLGTDGHSTSYYMAPGQVTSQSDAVSFMGFEETTATPGTTSPYGVEVLNNALYHPLDDMLMKSTASNYNISHKSMTEMIANRWSELVDKYWIMSSQLDNRLYYLVNNPLGEPLEDACKGNELWVYDTAAGESGTWSRFLIQAHALRKIEFGGRIHMSVIRPDGVYYLDPDYSRDDYVGDALLVGNRPIPWAFETNTQGANRAHDAWAHLQQVSMVVGNFQGSMRWGIKSWDLHGRAVDVSKQFTDVLARPEDSLPWDIEDRLLVQKDVMEWRLYAHSLTDVESSGQISLVQYRYTPVSVNVGYEHGTVESFEYARNVANGNDAIAFNGVPVPTIDTRRP